ncbi:hypothetical protein DMC63_35750 [Streptomyces sp. WAC 05977]|nr:hypothetical protein DMC63_35750 [Streptomyces sp. WAC 05977]
MAELPLEQVEHVAGFADEGVLAQAKPEIGERSLLLVAGALDETDAKGHLFHALDDSALVVTDSATAELAPRSTSRRGLTRIGDWSLAVGS